MRKFYGIIRPILAALLAATIAGSTRLPASIEQEWLNDSMHVLLIRTLDGGAATGVASNACGTDTHYLYSAVALEVERTVNPSATLLGPPGRVIHVCDTLEFKTYEREWVDEDCDMPDDPGKKDAGWCGKVYLSSGMDPDSPLIVSAAYASFMEEDTSVCDEAATKCGSSGESGSVVSAVDQTPQPTGSPIELSDVTIYNDGGTYIIENDKTSFTDESLVVSKNTTLVLEEGGYIAAPLNTDWPAVR